MTGDHDSAKHRPHPFFWAVLVISIPAGAVSAITDGRTPGYALNSEWVYRLQLALAVFAGLYMIVIAYWLAYKGRSFSRLDLPGGPGVAAPEPGLADAAEGFDAFRDAVQERLDDHDDSLDDLDDRMAEFETLHRFRDRLRWVILGR